MNWIKAAVFLGVVTLVFLVTGVRTLDRDEENKKEKKPVEKNPGL